jgi:hypothetical protein
MTIPRYVLGTAAEATRILHRLNRSGWHPRAGFALPPLGTALPPHLVLFGRVPTMSAATVAATSANRGVGIVAIAEVNSAPGRMLLSVLESLGPVLRTADAFPDGTGAAPLHNGAVLVSSAGDNEVLAALLPEQRALLGRLANGETIATAAAAEYLSLRTANRRIAQARSSLGVRTTREAVLVFLKQRRPDS